MFTKGGIFSAFIFVIFVSSFFVLSFAEDPGEPDTVRFEQWGTYVPCPPCSGKALVPVHIYHDEFLWKIQLTLGWSGPMICDSVWFVGERISHFPCQGYRIDQLNHWIFVGANSCGTDSLMPPGSGIIAVIQFTVEDTGLASVYDTETPEPEDVTMFYAWPQAYIVPEILSSENYIRPQDVLPGDVNDTRAVNLSDAIYLANYLLRGAAPPVFSGSADVNTDCQINLSDVILIAQWYFTGETPLQPGCAY